MNALQKKIYDYFDRDPELKVLFIFQGAVNAFDILDLSEAEWRTGYHYVEFKGDWFTTKYKLDNDWLYDKVVLYFNQESPLQRKSLQASFPLMDILTSNMEYHSQDYAAFLQQNSIPTTDNRLVRFVERNVLHLQSDKMM